MWDHPGDNASNGHAEQRLLSHDRPCQECGHALHTFLPCSDDCGCRPQWLPGALGAFRAAI